MKKNIKLTALLLGLLMVASAAMTACDSGKKACTEHTDANGDGVCDVCEAIVETESETASESVSESESDAPAAVTVTVSLSVKDQKGNAVSDAVMRILLLDEFGDQDSEWEPMIVTTDANGEVTVELAEGLYRLTYDALRENFLGAPAVLTVKEGMEPVTLEVTDNTPDGSDEHPFFLGKEGMTIADFPADSTYCFTLFAGDRRSVIIDNALVEVIMNDVTYTPDENGRITVEITGSNPEEHVYFTVRNNGEAQKVTVKIISEVGSMDNPIVIDAITAEAKDIVATIPAGVIMYYTWTADKDGTLKVTSQDETNNISLHNLTTGMSSSPSNGAAEVTLAVNAGDKIVLHVAMELTTGDIAEILFAVAVE